MHILTPSLFISVVSDTCRRYLLAQRVVVPGMVASIATVRPAGWKGGLLFP
jgi:hypothetical protein